VFVERDGRTVGRGALAQGAVRLARRLCGVFAGPPFPFWRDFRCTAIMHRAQPREIAGGSTILDPALLNERPGPVRGGLFRCWHGEPRKPELRGSSESFVTLRPGVASRLPAIPSRAAPLFAQKPAHQRDCTPRPCT
jgi:hypothetical protein